MMLEGTGLLHLLHLFVSEPVTKAIMKTLSQKTFTANLVSGSEMKNTLRLCC